MFEQFSSQATLQIFKIHYCRGDFGTCERYKSASKGTMPQPDLLPDGTLLKKRRQKGIA